MTLQLAISIALHQLATVVWIGGMFFAHFALRPSAQVSLEPPQRLSLLLTVFQRFFVWVWVAVGLLWATGFWIFFGIYDWVMGWHVYAMVATALVMTGLFAYVYFVPYRALSERVSAEDWPAAAQRVAVIRRVILVNLIIGLITAALGSAGRYLQ